MLRGLDISFVQLLIAIIILGVIFYFVDMHAKLKSLAVALIVLYVCAWLARWAGII